MNRAILIDTMSILAAPTSTPSVALRQRTDVISSLGPLLTLALQFQQLLSSATVLLSFRTQIAARVIGTALVLASKSVALYALLAFQIFAVRSASVAKQTFHLLWDSRRSRRVRRKIEFEFFVLLLGPGGNTLCLLLFWPGWIVMCSLAWAVWLGAS